MKSNTTILAGTAALSSLAIVFDYALKYSNLKIPFPWLPYLKFDFTGIPIVISALLFGLIPGMFTSAVASVAILARSGDILGSTSKGLAEFSTIIGMLIGLRMFRRFRAVTSISIGLASRVLIMTLVNLAFVYTGLLLIPSSYKQAASTWVLIVGIFNLAEGAISAVGGYVVFEAIETRAPSLVKRSYEEAFHRAVCKKIVARYFLKLSIRHGSNRSLITYYFARSSLMRTRVRLKGSTIEHMKALPFVGIRIVARPICTGLSLLTSPIQLRGHYLISSTCSP